MGLFRKKLKDILNKLEYNKINEAYDILEEHINAEHTVEGDLAGLAGVIRSYQQKLLDAKGKLSKIKSGSKKTSLSDVKLDIAAAQAELEKIQALISKLRSEVKIKLK